jgi:hypothetical protein
MLVFALAVFTLVALMGLAMALNIFRGGVHSKQYAMTHGGFALLGSALVIWAAIGGDERLYVNIGMAVVIIGLGAFMSIRRAKGLPVKSLAVLHGLLAVSCYGILAYFAFVR